MAHSCAEWSAGTASSTSADDRGIMSDSYSSADDEIHYISTIPLDCVAVIASFLSADDLLSFAAVSRDLRGTRSHLYNQLQAADIHELRRLNVSPSNLRVRALNTMGISGSSSAAARKVTSLIGGHSKRTLRRITIAPSTPLWVLQRLLAPNALPSLQVLVATGYESLSDALLCAIPAAAPRLCVIGLEKCWRLSEAALCTFIQATPQLTEVSLKGVQACSDTAVSVMAKRWRQLTRLSLTASRVTAATLAAATKNMSHLRRVCISDAHWTAAQWIDFIEAFAMPGRELLVDCASGFTRENMVIARSKGLTIRTRHCLQLNE